MKNITIDGIEYTPVKKGKTIKEWFEGVEDKGLRELLLERMDEEDIYVHSRKETVVNSFAEAVRASFRWRDTDEGNLFWYDVASGRITTYKKKEEWPKVGDYYWVETPAGEIVRNIFNNDNVDKKIFKHGNARKTREEVEARQALRMHIAKFDMPEVGDRVMFYENEIERFGDQDGNWDGDIWDNALFDSGVYMPDGLKQEDYDERVKLLEAVYGNKK